MLLRNCEINNKLLLFLILFAYFVLNAFSDQNITAQAVLFLNTNYTISRNLLAQPRGVVHFQQFGNETMKITGLVIGLKPLTWNGFTIHQMGTVTDGCPQAHFNPDDKFHGSPTSPMRHVGDLGNIWADSNGRVNLNMTDNNIQLAGPYSIIGRVIAVHSQPDDLGMGFTSNSLDHGNSGLPYVCGVIGVLSPNYSPVMDAYPSSIQVQFTNSFFYGMDARIANGTKPRLTYGRPARAEATIYSAANFSNQEYAQVFGRIVFEDQPSRGTVRLTGSLLGLPPGLHGIHIRQFGDLMNKCRATGEHYNPSRSRHGAAQAFERHMGDLSNILVDATGRVDVDIEDRAVRLTGPFSIIGRSIIITEKQDDLGIGFNFRSFIDGNSGRPIACGIIGIGSWDYTPLGLSLEVIRLADRVSENLRNNRNYNYLTNTNRKSVTNLIRKHIR